MKKLKMSTIFFFLLFLSCTPIKHIGNFSDHRNNAFTFSTDSSFTYEYRTGECLSGMGKYSSGKWTVQGNKIILNSYLKNITLPMQIIPLQEYSDTPTICVRMVTDGKYFNYETETMDTKSAEFYRFIPYSKEGNELYPYPQHLDISSLNDYELFFVEFVLENKFIRAKYPLEGNYCFNPTLFSDSIYFEIRGLSGDYTVELFEWEKLETEVKPVNMQGNSEVIIHITDSLFAYRIFDNQILEIKGKNLIFKDKVKDEENWFSLNVLEPLPSDYYDIGTHYKKVGSRYKKIKKKKR
jgi:hypothetical protein